MSIFVTKSGILSTIQDTGRNGFRRFGINPNGAMDVAAARLINILLANEESETVLEMHFPAPILKFEEAAIIALGGAKFGAQIDGKPIENWRPHHIGKDQTLSFSGKISGNRAYLTVKGGFVIERWLNSASTNLTAKIGGFEGRSLMKDDRLYFNSKFQISDSRFRYRIAGSVIPHYSSMPTLRVIAGAEFERLTAFSESNFLKNNFTITRNSNRMGFRLNGEPLYLLNKIELISSAVTFGTIQLLPDGQMIILMADHQTSGGYPRVAHVASADLPVLAQLGAGDKVNFEIISIEEAEDLALEFERELNFLKVGVNCKNLF